jgi:hypothetical protein
MMLTSPRNNVMCIGAEIEISFHCINSDVSAHSTPTTLRVYNNGDC